MEFIPLENYNKKFKKNVKVGNETTPKIFKKNSIIEEKILKKGKKKPQTKTIKKKEVKTKINEAATKRKVFEKATKKKKIVKYKEEKEENFEENNVQEKTIENKTEENEVEEESLENKDVDEEEAFKKKCKEMDEKKKNRLFIKLKKKILNETQIKELHPDIRSVIFPRKKNTRWCWAVFASKEKADKAMKKLIKNKDVLVNKPTPYERVELKRKEKMKTILRKKQARKKLQEMWL